eukprot:4744607-Ditylum_brightwellii.AAC.1
MKPEAAEIELLHLFSQCFHGLKQQHKGDQVFQELITEFEEIGGIPKFQINLRIGALEEVSWHCLCAKELEPKSDVGNTHLDLRMWDTQTKEC